MTDVASLSIHCDPLKKTSCYAQWLSGCSHNHPPHGGKDGSDGLCQRWVLFPGTQQEARIPSYLGTTPHPGAPIPPSCLSARAGHCHVKMLSLFSALPTLQPLGQGPYDAQQLQDHRAAIAVCLLCIRTQRWSTTSAVNIREKEPGHRWKTLQSVHRKLQVAPSVITP